MFKDQALDLADIVVLYTDVISKHNWIKPEFALSVRRSDVDMGWFRAFI
jgi:hypothetical protein